MWRISSQLQDRFRTNEANKLVCKGVRTFLNLPDHETATQLGPWTWWSDWRDRRTHGQLLQSDAERFPVNHKAFPERCVFWVGPCPALVHPETLTIFGLRVGSYLQLLRLPSEARQQAIDANAAWARCPLPALRGLDVPAVFGPDWVVPNILHPTTTDWLYKAFDAAG